MPSPTDNARKLRREWFIDVCKTCDRIATWPFCEHRSVERKWTEMVRVRAVGRRVE